jgi:hypothetical protein
MFLEDGLYPIKISKDDNKTIRCIFVGIDDYNKITIEKQDGKRDLNL